MPHEVDVTIQMLDSLLYSSLDKLTVLILVNGGRAELLRNSIESITQVQLFESEENLGVAGGRAFLAAQAAAKQADVISFIDNDLLLPTDYLHPLCMQVMTDRNTGVVGASILNYRHMTNWLTASVCLEKGPLGRLLPRFVNSDVRFFLEKNNRKEFFSHLGDHPDWMRTYFPRLTLKDEYMRRRGLNLEDNVFLAKNSQVLLQFQASGSKLIETSNVAGCTQTFRRDLYDEIGGVRKEYSPYGYEDVDFAIRAQRAGYRNYTLTHAFSLHGTDDRHQQRKTISGLWPSTRNLARAYVLLMHSHCPWSRRPFLLKNFLIKMGFDLLSIVWRLIYETGGLLLRMSASMAGFFQALMLIITKRMKVETNHLNQDEHNADSSRDNR
jgi:GT2 family glycosyltransferase